MENRPSARPGCLAYLVILAGVFLLLLGLVSTATFLAGGVVGNDVEVTGAQMVSMAGMFLGLVCGALALYHGWGSIKGRDSRPLQLPAFYLFWILFALVLGIGNLIAGTVAPGLLFPPLYLLGAALPVCAVLAWAARRLGSPITWREGALALVAGSTLSILLASILELILPLLVLLLFPPIRMLAEASSDTLAYGATDPWQRLLLSPLVIVFLLMVAMQAPIPEEFSKGLCAILFGRRRIKNQAQALMLGLAIGSGFAIMENMLYEGFYAWNEGWSWGGVTLLRGLGAALHPVCTALVVLGWFRVPERGWGELFKAYAAAVGLHTLWNGGFSALVFISGLDALQGYGPSVSLYGQPVQVLLIVYLGLLAGASWLLLNRLLSGLGTGQQPALAPTLISRRAIAAWAVLCALVIVPLGAALGPAWTAIQPTILP